MSATDTKSALVSALAGFAARPLPEAASALFAALGYGLTPDEIKIVERATHK